MPELLVCTNCLEICGFGPLGRCDCGEHWEGEDESAFLVPDHERKPVEYVPKAHVAALTEAFDQEQARRIRAEERVEALEAALADNKGAGFWFRGWERAREHYERPRTLNVPNRDAEHPGKENFRLSGLTERKVSPKGDGEREELMRELTRETERLGLYEWQDDQPEKKGDTDG